MNEAIHFSAAESCSTPETFKAMAKKQAHRFAEEDTPERVTIPDSWAGIMMWALGRHGPVVLFVAATWFLYQDNKVYQKDLLEVAKTQIAINSQMVAQLTELKTSIATIANEAEKAHRRTIAP